MNMFAYHAICHFYRVQRLPDAKHFPKDTEVCEGFSSLKHFLMNIALHFTDNSKSYGVDCDASDVCVYYIKLGR